MDAQSPLPKTASLLLVGVGLSAFSSGAIASISLITVPALLSTTTNTSLLTTWLHTFNNGVRICPPFAVAATVAHIANAYLARNSPSNRARYLAIAGVSTIAIVPFTMLFMGSTNRELFRLEQAARGTTADVEVGAVDLVRKWGRLNLMRSLLPSVGALVACFAL